MSKSAIENLTAAVTTINTPMPIRIDEDTARPLERRFVWLRLLNHDQHEAM
jgi:hypothetical protein